MEHEITETVDGAESLDLELTDLTEACRDAEPDMAGACGSHSAIHSS